MKRIFATSILGLSSLFAISQEQKIEFEEYDLDNGIHVILHEDHTTPIVAVSIMYHVGSKNENPNRTGFAHFFEHLLFEGTQNIDRGEYSELVEKNGGTLNANTSQDRTYYYEILPSNQLELGIWMESERLLHAKVDQVGIDTQREVVKEEKRQRTDNQPYATFVPEAFKRMYKKHPYNWVPIGSMDHLDAAQEEDYVNFYRTFYVPANAVISIAGDIDIKDTKKLVEKYFGSIPSGEAINLYRDVESLTAEEFEAKYKVAKSSFDLMKFNKPKNKAAKTLYKSLSKTEIEIPRPNIVEEPLTEKIVDTIYDNITLPGVFYTYRSPAQDSDDAYALDMLNTILASGSSSRMNKVFVDQKQMAMQAFSFAFPLEDPGITLIGVIASKDADLDSLRDAMDAEVVKMQNELISEEELQKVKNQYENQFYSSNGRIAGIAENLANNFMYFNNTDRINSELASYQNITREDIMRVAKKYLQQNSRVELYYLPKK